MAQAPNCLSLCPPSFLFSLMARPRCRLRTIHSTYSSILLIGRLASANLRPSDGIDGPSNACSQSRARHSWIPGTGQPPSHLVDKQILGIRLSIASHSLLGFASLSASSCAAAISCFWKLSMPWALLNFSVLTLNQLYPASWSPLQLRAGQMPASLDLV